MTTTCGYCGKTVTGSDFHHEPDCPYDCGVAERRRLRAIFDAAPTVAKGIELVMQELQVWFQDPQADPARAMHAMLVERIEGDTVTLIDPMNPKAQD